MKRALLKDSLKQIVKTHRRFISILLMAFLGVGFFAGVRATAPDMRNTIDNYYDEKNVYDIRLISTLGLTQDDVDAISKLESTESVEGLFIEDTYVRVGDEDVVVRIYPYSSNMNDVELKEGKLPENIDECVVENSMKSDGIGIGDTITIEEDLGEDEDPSFKNKTLKVVGIIGSPLYMSRDRGTTTLGSGKLSYFIYINKDNIQEDYYTELNLKVKGAKEEETISDEYDALVDKSEKELKSIQKEREQARYDELIKEATDKVNEAQAEFDKEKKDAEDKIKEAEDEIADGKRKIANGEKEIANGEKELQTQRTNASVEFTNAENQLNDASQKLDQGQTELNNKINEFNSKKPEAEAGIKQLQDGIKQVQDGITGLNQIIASYDLATKSINEIQGQIDALRAQEKALEEERASLDPEADIDRIKEINNELGSISINETALNAEIEKIKSSLDEKKAELEDKSLKEAYEEAKTQISALQTQQNDLKKKLDETNSTLKNAQDEINKAQAQINQGRADIEKGRAELASKRAEADQKFKEAEDEIAKNKKKIADSKKEITDGEKELEEKKLEFNEKISDAEAKLIDAREKINDIETAKWYIFNRYDLNSFNSYAQDSDNIKKLGIVFPIAFFLIATLISLTTMSRMVEEERVQIGTLKALGYNNMQIMSKYIIYSLLASVIGGLLGATFGVYFFPYVIILMYQVMYEIPRVSITYNVYYTILGIGIMSFCMIAACIYTAIQELKNTPAELMRPKAPKMGKRVLIERITFIWKHLSFIQKVTLRNMFRYKKRFLMTVIGIGGCMALILAGFGLEDSISRIMDRQYGEIYHYDLMIGLKNTLTDEEIDSLVTTIDENEKIDKSVKAYMTSYKAEKDDSIETQVVAINKNEDIESVVTLRDYKTKEKIELSDDKVILSEKLAQLINAHVGDEIVLKDVNEDEFKVTVGAINENYIAHYVYMTDTLYTKVFNEEENPNVLMTKYNTEISKEEEDNFSKELLKNVKINSVVSITYLKENMNNTLEAMDLVVIVLIISAGLLAFIVLYNLANVNISERIRELATIKVLGFYDKEVYDYVTREIILLTIIGIILGIGLGYILNSFILSTCEIEVLKFKKVITVQSYMISAAITTIFTLIVNFITYFSLKKVDMIESLKSVE